MPRGTHPVSIEAVPIVVAAILSLALAACGPAGSADANNMSMTEDANATLQAAEENAAAMAQDDDLANEAAADEAADTDVFGGNAAAGEGDNSAPEPSASNGAGL